MRPKNEPEQAILDYEAPEAGVTLPPPIVAIVMCLPMVLIGFLCIPAPLRPITPLFLFRWFWVLRAFAMICAISSIFLFADRRVRRLPWFARLNLMINIPGLAACTFGILRYVVVNLPV